MDFNWGVLGLAIAILLVGGIVGYAIAPSEPTGLTDTEVDAKIANAVKQAVFQKNAEIETLKGLIGVLENKTIEEPEEVIGYLIDELFLSMDLTEKTYSDREVITLFDGKVDFDGKDYDAEETLILKDIELLANENDFEGKVYMTVPEGAIEYKLEFEDDLNTSEVTDEETLEFTFLGENYEVSKWDGTIITLTKGTEYIFKPLEGVSSVTVDGKVVTIVAVSDTEVFVEVDGVGRSIDEDKTKTINGLEIKAKDCFESETHIVAILVIGEEIEVTIENNEEYEEDSAWGWVITSNSIGIVLVEKFTEIDLDGDEEFQAIGVEEKLCLPNEYVCVQFNGMVEEDTEEYYFELDEDFVRIEGNFEVGTKDYDKIYVFKNGSIYEDDDLESYIGEEVELSNEDLVISANGNRILINDTVSGDYLVRIDLDLTQIQVDKVGSDWNNITSEDEDYLTNYGILVINPEDSAEDQEFNIFVPEEKLEGSITLI